MKESRLTAKGDGVSDCRKTVRKLSFARLFCELFYDVVSTSLGYLASNGRLIDE
jgi:hypothetical protein